MSFKAGVDLLVPGLFGPVPVHPADVPDLPVLEKLLGRADRTPANGSDPIAFLLDRFRIERAPGLDPPSAPFSRLSDNPDADPGGFWLHADPVHLRPDLDRLLLFDARHLGLEREETDSLVALFNGHFAADGLHLEAPVNERWYLRVDMPPRIRTSALAEVIGRSVERSSLTGEDAAEWMRWLNEAQMLFHHAEVNQRRELAGRPMVSGIWPWGGGTLPASVPQSPYELVLARDPLTLGLALAAGVAIAPIPEDRDAMPAVGWSEGRILVHWDDLERAVLDGDGAAWVRQLSRLERWLRTSMERVRAGEMGEIALFPGNGSCLRTTRRTLRRFWRRPAPFASWMQLKAEA